MYGGVINQEVFALEGVLYLLIIYTFINLL